MEDEILGVEFNKIIGETC